MVCQAVTAPKSKLAWRGEPVVLHLAVAVCASVDVPLRCMMHATDVESTASLCSCRGAMPMIGCMHAGWTSDTLQQHAACESRSALLWPTEYLTG